LNGYTQIEKLTAKRSGTIIKNKNGENMHTDRCGNTSGQKCHAKGSGKESKIQEFVCGDTPNVEREVYDHTGVNLSHWFGNKRFKGLFESHTRKTFNRLNTKFSCTSNIIHNAASTTMYNLLESSGPVKACSGIALPLQQCKT
jgi:hypothetical protein